MSLDCDISMGLRCFSRQFLAPLPHQGMKLMPKKIRRLQKPGSRSCTTLSKSTIEVKKNILQYLYESALHQWVALSYIFLRNLYKDISFSKKTKRCNWRRKTKSVPIKKVKFISIRKTKLKVSFEVRSQTKVDKKV